MITWGLIAALGANVIAGTTFAIRLEGETVTNSNEIRHVKELQQQKNNAIEEALQEQKQDIKEIKRLIIEALKKE